MPKKTAHIHIKVDPEFKDACRKYCESRGVTFSEVFRGAMVDTLTMAGAIIRNGRVVNFEPEKVDQSAGS